MLTVEERLSSLEKKVSRYRNMNLTLLVILVAVVSVAATDVVPLHRMAPVADPPNDTNQGVRVQGSEIDQPTQAIPLPARANKSLSQVQGAIQTTRLDIVNSNGETVLTLGQSADGEGLLFVNGSDGENLIYLGPSSQSDDGLVLINSKENKNLISLGANLETGDGYINIRNRNEERVINLFTRENNGGIDIVNPGVGDLVYLGGNSTNQDGLLYLNSNAGKREVTLVAGQTGGYLSLKNSEDYDIVNLGRGSDGQGRLRVNSNTGTELVTVGSNTSDNGLIRVSNSVGLLGAYIIAGDKNGIIGILDIQDNSLARMSATSSGEGLLRTYTPNGITAWSSDANTSVSSSTSKKGDLDNDGDVDGDDFLIFSEQYNKN